MKMTLPELFQITVAVLKVLLHFFPKLIVFLS